MLNSTMTPWSTLIRSAIRSVLVISFMAAPTALMAQDRPAERPERGEAARGAEMDERARAARAARAREARVRQERGDQRPSAKPQTREERARMLEARERAGAGRLEGARGDGARELTEEQRRARLEQLRKDRATKLRQDGRLRGAEQRGVRDLERRPPRDSANRNPGYSTRRRLHKMENDHNMRVAKLERLLQVARENRDEETVTRIDGLMKRETAAFESKAARLRTSLKRQASERVKKPMDPERAARLKALREKRTRPTERPAAGGAERGAPSERPAEQRGR